MTNKISMIDTLQANTEALKCRPAESFWNEFREQAEAARRTPKVIMWPTPAARLLVAAACLALITAGALLLRPTTGTIASPVLSVTVDVEYNSMMILEDGESGGTVLWVEEA